jgi:hypothetical protein
VYGASAPDADALGNIETARENMDLIEKSLGKLPSNAAMRMQAFMLRRQPWRILRPRNA